MDKYRITYWDKHENFPHTTIAKTDEIEITSRGALLFKRKGEVILGFNEKRWISFTLVEPKEDNEE